MQEKVKNGCSPVQYKYKRKNPKKRELDFCFTN